MKDKKISFFTLLMISCAMVISIRNLPTVAETGMRMIVFGIFAAIFFLIPVALSSAELSTGWPKLGGVYAWVKEAFGKKWGMVASWLQWVYMTNSVVAMVYFISGSLAFVISPKLASDRLFLMIVSLSVIWTFTFLNMKGIKFTGWMSTVGFLSGVLLPGLLVIFLAIIHLIKGNPVAIDLSFTKSNLLPDFSHLANLVLLLGFMRAFVGMEASAAHANLVENPKKSFPLVILFVIIIGLVVNIFGSMSIAVVVPREEISLIAGIMEAFTVFFAKFNVAWIVPVLGILVAFGQMAGVSSWLVGPVKGLLATANDGDLPPFFRIVNKHNVPVPLLILQAVVISAIAIVLLRFRSINVAFWVSVALSMMIYVTMFFMILLSVLVLRYKQPKVKRAYKIPFGKFGVWTVSLVGMATMVFSFIMALFPPVQFDVGNHSVYVTFLIISIAVIYAIPFIIYSFKKPSWKKANWKKTKK